MGMTVKASDVVDRWTILRMKIEYADDARPDYILYSFEMDSLVRRFLNDPAKSVPFVSAVADLAAANGRIWENEAAIRREYDNDPSASSELTLTEIGRRALLIRKFNGQRNEAKETIDLLVGDTTEPKVDHVSA